MNASTPRSLGAIALLALLLPGCSGWTLDYGKEAAHAEAKDAAVIAQRHLGEKIVVRGAVASVDISNAEDCVVRLEGPVVARFGDLKAMAEELRVGEVITIMGLVESVDGGVVTLDPAARRDPFAPFEPEKP